MRLTALTLCTLLLAGCGGGGEDAPTAPNLVTLSPGLYDVYDNASAAAFELVAAPSGAVVFADYKGIAGLASAEPGPSAVTLSAVHLTRQTDDLGNGAPGAQPPVRELVYRLVEHPNGYRGDGLDLTRRERSAPPVASLPRNWHFHNLYRFNQDFIDYTAQIDIDSAGVLSGFDTNGCVFSGEITRASSSLYRIDILTRACGATARFIPNGLYVGYAYVIDDGSTTTLRLIAGDKDLRYTIALTLFPG